MPCTQEQALQIFTAHRGVLRMSEALDAGIPARKLYALRDNGLIRLIGRGLYQLMDQPAFKHPEVVQVTLRAPKAVICLQTALMLHGLGEYPATPVYIALPQSAEKPRLAEPELHITWFSDGPYAAGRETVVVDGFELPIYSKEKTIVDCFKFRNKIGLDIGLNALKRYLAAPNPAVAVLLEYAQINRETERLARYLEALL